MDEYLEEFLDPGGHPVEYSVRVSPGGINAELMQNPLE